MKRLINSILDSPGGALVIGLLALTVCLGEGVKYSARKAQEKSGELVAVYVDQVKEDYVDEFRKSCYEITEEKCKERYPFLVKETIFGKGCKGLELPWKED